MSKLSGLLLLAIALVLTVQAQELHPKLQKKEKRIRQVLILPPRIEITKQTMKGRESMLKEAEGLESRIIEAITSELKARGVQVLETTISSSAAPDNDVRYVLADLQKRFDALAPKMLKKSRDVGAGRFSLGDEVANLSQANAVDAMLFIRAEGEEVTSSKKAFSLLVPFTGSAVSRLTLSIALVDAKTGEVLYLARPSVVGSFTSKSGDAVRKAITKSLKKLPASS